MAYYKTIEDGYIVAIGNGGMGEEITDTEYNNILSVIHNKPKETTEIGYRLKSDLTWEQYEKEPEPEPDLTNDEILAILLGEGEEE